MNVFVPHIGKTFIDNKENIEYEIKDVVRSLKENKYGVQVILKPREKRYNSFI